MHVPSRAGGGVPDVVTAAAVVSGGSSLQSSLVSTVEREKKGSLSCIVICKRNRERQRTAIPPPETARERILALLRNPQIKRGRPEAWRFFVGFGGKPHRFLIRAEFREGGLVGPFVDRHRTKVRKSGCNCQLSARKNKIGKERRSLLELLGESKLAPHYKNKSKMLPAWKHQRKRATV